MGIHYCAWSVAPRDIPQALSASARFAQIEPAQSQFRVSDTSLVLELGRCWRCLQSVFGLGTQRERPCVELVRAPASHSGLGQGPYTRVLTPIEVEAIASDLAVLVQESDDSDLRSCLFQFPTDAVRPHIEAALDFTRAVAASGQGLVYAIGAAVPGSTCQ